MAEYEPPVSRRILSHSGFPSEIVIGVYHFPRSLSKGPCLQFIIRLVPAEPFPCLFVEEKGDASTIAIVKLLEQGHILAVMPHLQLGHMHLFLFFQFTNERMHLFAVGAFCAVEKQQSFAFFFIHGYPSSTFNKNRIYMIIV